MNYASADVNQCRTAGHRFQIVGSDKTPMKRSIQCLTCTFATGKSVFVAYGDETKSFGQWRKRAEKNSADLSEVQEPETGEI